MILPFISRITIPNFIKNGKTRNFMACALSRIFWEYAASDTFPCIYIYIYIYIYKVEHHLYAIA